MCYGAYSLRKSENKHDLPLWGVPIIVVVWLRSASQQSHRALQHLQVCCIIPKCYASQDSARTEADQQREAVAERPPAHRGGGADGRDPRGAAEAARGAGDDVAAGAARGAAAAASRKAAPEELRGGRRHGEEGEQQHGGLHGPLRGHTRSGQVTAHSGRGSAAVCRVSCGSMQGQVTA